MSLTLLTGPANVGKIALLLERYLARLDDEPLLIVPNRSDVDRVERDLLRRTGCLLAGSIGTFDDAFERIAAGDPDRRPVATDAQRTLAARRAIAACRPRLTALARSAGYPGFVDSLLGAAAELESGLLEPEDLGGEPAELYAAYRRALDELALWDRDRLRRRAAQRLQRDLDAWHGEPVFAYGFEDLTAAQWTLLEAFAGRADVQVSLPYEPGRLAFASLRRTAESLAALAERVEELAPPAPPVSPAPLARIERLLFEPGPHTRAPLDGSVRFLEGAGARSTLELVAGEILSLLRRGVRPERIGLVAPTLERWHSALDTVLSTFDVPYAIEARIRLGATPFGRALTSLLRFAWVAGGRTELYAYLRSPYSGVSRSAVDFVEGRLRGRAISAPDRVEAETERLREAPLAALRELRAADSPLEGVRTLLGSMLRSAYGVEAPPVGESSRLDLRCQAAARTIVDELSAWEALGGSVSPDELISALEHANVRASDPGDGRVAVLDLLRARTRQFDFVFVLGLEEGVFPRRGRSSLFLDDDRRRELGARLERPEPVARDRYLFYAACSRAALRLTLVREAASDDGAPREASPFWDEVVALFDSGDVRRWTKRRHLAELTWQLGSAPTERERVRAVARLAGEEGGRYPAEALAYENGWTRRLLRARHAFDRRTALVAPTVLAELAGRRVFGATELERYADCSSAWLFERVVDPKTIDAEVDALLRGKVAHQALYAFYSGLPKELGADRVTQETLDDALLFLDRCLDEALHGGVRLDLSELEAAELREGLSRDLRRFVRDEASSPLRLQPRRFEVGFGTERSAPELQPGIELGDGLSVSGKIDRIDVDPFSARGMVQDYKSGRSSYGARQIDDERRLQVPLYLLVLRDLVGVEPLGGVYRALAGARAARGLLRAGARDDLPGFKPSDYLEEDAFWTQIETARARAREYAERIRRGDVRHDPRGGECPSWCRLWTMCRVERA